MRFTRAHIGLVVLTTIIVGAGVSVANLNAHTPTTSKRVISMSIAKEYKTLAELKRDADAVVLVSVEGEPSPSHRDANVPTVDVRIRVVQVFAGETQVGDTLTLVQYGDLSGQITVEDSIPILQNGKRYVVYLNRQFPNQSQMLVTGQVGTFEAGSGTEFHRIGEASPDLPKIVSLNQF